MVKTGFTPKVRELLKSEGPKTSREILKRYGHLISSRNPSYSIKGTKDIDYLGSPSLRVYYVVGDEDQAKKRYEELRKESIEKQKQYLADYGKKHKRKIPIIPRDPNINSVLDIFTNNRTTYTTRDVWKKVGGSIWTVGDILNKYADAGVLLIEEGRPKRFKRNPLFAKVCDGAFEKAEKEISSTQ